MDAILLARIQFALTVGFHYIFPPLTIGMSWLIFIFQSIYLKTNDSLYDRLSRFWIKLFTISFVIGVATGITMEFQFGTNWANYSRFVGDIFGAPLAAEGVLSFFLESTFLGILLYGYNKVSKRAYWFSSAMVAFGATLSALWIIIANSWQQTPRGFIVANGKAQLTNFFEAALNPSTMPRYLHSIDGALITGAFFILGVSAYYIIKGIHLDVAKKSFKIALGFAFVTSLLQIPIGHYHAVQVAETQPVKLAAFEGLWETQSKAPILLFGIPNVKEERTDYAVKIPGLLSYLVSFDTETIVHGLKEFPKEDRPPIHATFMTFHMMLALGGFFIGITALALAFRSKVFEQMWLMKIFLYSIPLPFIANQLGWMAAEIGRQPWIVYNLMRTRDAISPTVSAGEIIFSIIMFSCIYALLFGVWIFLLRHRIQEGPSPEYSKK